MSLPNIIGVSGGFGHGKDAVVSILVERFGYERHAFADCLKLEVKRALTELDYRDYVWNRMPVPCRDAVLTCLAVGDLDPFIKPTTPDMRSLLQLYGTEFRRAQDQDYWIQALFDNTAPGTRVAVSDVRFRNEADLVREKGGQVWRVLRMDAFYAYSDKTRHSSERDLDGYEFDQVIINDGTLDDLEGRVVATLMPPAVMLSALRTLPPSVLTATLRNLDAQTQGYKVQV